MDFAILDENYLETWFLSVRMACWWICRTRSREISCLLANSSNVIGWVS